MLLDGLHDQESLLQLGLLCLMVLFTAHISRCEQVVRRQETIQKEIEDCIEDMDQMAKLLDELDELSRVSVDLDVKLIDKKIDNMMLELGFVREDNDRLVCINRSDPFWLIDCVQL